MRHALLLFIALILFLVTRGATAAPKPNVDALLVIAVDVSGSVDTQEYELQFEGVLQALEDPELAYILETCNGAGVAITYVEWAGDFHRRAALQMVDWKLVRNRRDLRDLSEYMKQNVVRRLAGETDILSALRFSTDLMNTAPYTSNRKIINLSSDGTLSLADIEKPAPALFQPHLFEAALRSGREEILEQGIVIDAMPIGQDQMGPSTPASDLPAYFERNVRGGAGSFVSPIQSYQDYAGALKRMMIRELNNCGS